MVIENKFETETAGDLVKRLEQIPENKRDFSQTLQLALAKQCDPEEIIYSIPAEFNPITHKEVLEFLKRYDKFEERSKKAKFILGGRYKH